MITPLTPASQQPMLALLAVLLLTSGTVAPETPVPTTSRLPSNPLPASAGTPLEQTL